MAIQPLKSVIDNSLTTISRYQKGEIKQIKTNREWFDHQGGLTPKTIILIVAASFGGKSTELESLKADIMDEEVNPNAKNFVWLSNAFEMTNFATTLRDIKKQTKKDLKEILSSEFSEEEKVILRKYYEQKTDGRFYVNQVPQTAKQFIDSVDRFLSEHTDKELVVIDLDHIGLTRASNDNKKVAVDDVVEGLNELKNKYDNFVVIILSQLNRSILGRLKEKSNESAIRRDDIYQSDTIYHISDYVIGLQNANYLGIDEYRKVKTDKYPHLEHRFTDEDAKGRVSLVTEGCIFVEVLKDRTADIGYVDIYTIEIKPFEKEEAKLTPKIEAPIFDTVKFNASPEEAFGDEEKAPF